MSNFKNEDRYKNLERVNAWVANCDAKASYLLTLLGVVFTVVATSSYSVTFVEVFKYPWILKSFGFQNTLRFLEAVALYACVILLIEALNSLYHVLFAKIDPSVFGQQGLISQSLLFFGTIGEITFNEFSQKCEALTDKELQAHIDSQTYINAKICQTKFINYNKALKFCRYAFIAGFVFLIIRFFY